MNKKINKIISFSLATIIAASSILSVNSNTYAKENLHNSYVSYKDYKNYNEIYKIIKDDKKVRVVTYSEKNANFTLIYNKIENSLTVEKEVKGKTSTNLYRNNTPVPYTYFSPWNYEKSGNKYKLTAVIDTNTKTKTAFYRGSNKGHIDRFIDAVDDVKADEIKLMGTIGFEALMAIFTGGLSLPAVIIATYGMVSEGNAMLKHYDRAKKAFLQIK